MNTMTEPDVNDTPIPFGKYKGQPLEVLHTDPNYRDWFLWLHHVRTRYPNLVEAVFACEPTETPWNITVENGHSTRSIAQLNRFQLCINCTNTGLHN